MKKKATLYKNLWKFIRLASYASTSPPEVVGGHQPPLVDGIAFGDQVVGGWWSPTTSGVRRRLPPLVCAEGYHLWCSPKAIWWKRSGGLCVKGVTPLKRIHIVDSFLTNSQLQYNLLAQDELLLSNNQQLYQTANLQSPAARSQ
jgi:hypothetical protein